MRLLEWKDYQVQVSPEALLVRPIRKLYNADRSAKKEKFFQQMSYLFFMIDPRSTYSYITDPEEREKQIKMQEGLPDDFVPSKDLEEAMEAYSKHVITSSSELLAASRIAASALREELEQTKTLLAERTDKGQRVTKAGEVMALLERLMNMVPKLRQLEKQVDSDIYENTRAKGNETAMFEDGI